MQGSGVAITSCGRETKGNMLRPEIDSQLVAAGSSPVRAHYSLKCFVMMRTCLGG